MTERKHGYHHAKMAKGTNGERITPKASIDGMASSSEGNINISEYAMNTNRSHQPQTKVILIRTSYRIPLFRFRTLESRSYSMKTPDQLSSWIFGQLKSTHLMIVVRVWMWYFAINPCVSLTNCEVSFSQKRFILELTCQHQPQFPRRRLRKRKSSFEIGQIPHPVSVQKAGYRDTHFVVSILNVVFPLYFPEIDSFFSSSFSTILSCVFLLEDTTFVRKCLEQDLCCAALDMRGIQWRVSRLYFQNILICQKWSSILCLI